MRDQRTAILAAVDRSAMPAVGALAELSYGEWAVALGAAERAGLDLADVVSAASRGLAWLGGAGVRDRLAESDRLVREMYHGRDRQARGRAGRDHSRLWGGREAFGRVHGALERAWWTECADCEGYGCGGCGQAGHVDLPTSLRAGLAVAGSAR